VSEGPIQDRLITQIHGVDFVAGDSSKISIWTGYFDSRLSRSQGRRVSLSSSIPNPNLEQLAFATKSLGVRKMKRVSNKSHPKRPRLNEGLLIVSAKDAYSATGTESKERLMHAIGLSLFNSHEEAKLKKEESKLKGPRKGDRSARSQRKGPKVKSQRRKKKFGRK
tara:strand:+ start:926 stop:1423 length:498 start_codon:yes stop_codon:yes gene_type:complete